MAQFAFNSAKLLIIGKSLFYANYGYKPNAYREVRPDTTNAQLAIKWAETLRNLHKYLQESIMASNKKSWIYADKRRLNGPTFKEGDKVYLY